MPPFCTSVIALFDSTNQNCRSQIAAKFVSAQLNDVVYRSSSVTMQFRSGLGFGGGNDWASHLAATSWLPQSLSFTVAGSSPQRVAGRDAPSITRGEDRSLARSSCRGGADALLVWAPRRLS